MDCRINDKDSGSPENWVLATKDSKLYIAMKKGKIDLQKPKKMDPSTWNTLKDKVRCQPPVRLLPENLWPQAKSSYHRFRPRRGEDSSAVFAKKRNPLELVISSSHGFQRVTQDDKHRRMTEREIEICEFIRQAPSHPNIAKYRGLVCKSELKCRSSSGDMKAVFDTERVTKVIFKHYTASLQDWVLKGKPVDLTHCLKSIADGVEHLHSIGLVHCDIKPDNVFVDDTGERCEYVVGDFDSSAKTGSICELKGGDRNWSRTKRTKIDTVEDEDDWYAFESTKVWLVKKLGGRLSDY